MRALSAAELLDAWEQGMGQTPIQQALALLAPACPERSPEALARLSIGRRDAGLLALRERTFGPRLLSLATCPACGERLELAFDVADVQSSSLFLGGDGGEGHADPLSMTVDGYELRFRLPNSLDLEAVADCADAAAARQALLQRCLLDARHRGGEVAAGQLPSAVEEAMVETMALADPQADIVLDLSCPACDQRWGAIFDIAFFFWGELDAWARRTLREVHLLASAYGWGEAEILALSPWRRQAYLEMVA
jgi:hypothetical protein